MSSRDVLKVHCLWPLLSERRELLGEFALNLIIRSVHTQLVKAVLSQILHDDISSSNVNICIMLHGTVLAIGHAILPLRV